MHPNPYQSPSPDETRQPITLLQLLDFGWRAAICLAALFVSPATIIYTWQLTLIQVIQRWPVVLVCVALDAFWIQCWVKAAAIVVKLAGTMR